MNAIILSAVWGIVMMYAGIFLKQQSTLKYIAIAGTLVLIIANWLEFAGILYIPIDTKGLSSSSTFGLLFNTIALVSTLVYFLLSGTDIGKVNHNTAEYFALIFFILSGVAIISAFESLLMLFIGIEIISIPLYILAGSDKRNLKSNEASLKYFLMGAFSTGLMLMGIAFLYGATGTFSIAGLNAGLGEPTVLMTLGIVLLMVSMSFKASAAPFHFWTPDVYDGTPTVFTSFMATIVKSAVFIAFFRLFNGAFGKFHPQWQLIVAIITALTLIIGNITAVFQQSVKRMLSYSSIAQAGFMMLSLFALNNTAKEGLLLYVSAYSIATIGIFAVLIKMKDYTFEGFNGLAKQEPLIALALTIFLLSLAGIPLTAGFFSKYFLLAAAIKTKTMFWLIIVAVVCAAISITYYFRIIQAVYFKESEERVIAPVSNNFKVMLLLTAALILIIGIKPSLLLSLLFL